MKRIGIALLFLAMCASAAAQTPSPVLQHYRAYQAALEANDLVAAEAAAQAALEASETRDGDGGRTAVLALNLATVRFLANDAAGALAPARRALGLAVARGDASGVPASLAQLIVGRAELALERDAGLTRIAEALPRAMEEELPPAEIYDAAVALGHGSFARRQYSEAREAWSIAASYAEGARFPEAYAGGRARVGAAAARIMEDLVRFGRQNGQLSVEGAVEARTDLEEAIALLAPLAEIENPNGGMTLAQNAYAEATAWRAVLRAKVSSDDLDLPASEGEAQGDADGFSEIGAGGAMTGQPRCLLDVHQRPRITFPQAALNDSSVGGVALLMRINAAGELVEARSVATVGRPEFAAAVDRVVGRWSVTRHADSAPNCRMAMAAIFSVVFAIRH